MRMEVIVEDEAGHPKSIVRDERNQLAPLMGEPNYCDSPMISLIRPCGVTTFNALQASQFLAEWRAVLKNAITAEQKEIASRVAVAAAMVRDNPNLSLKFVRS